QAGATATHSYTAAGSFTVTATVKDTAGLSSTATASVTVSAPDAPPAAALTVVPTAGQAPLAVAADASASTDTDLTGIQSYTFNFGDGTVVGPQATATAGHTHAAARPSQDTGKLHRDGDGDRHRRTGLDGKRIGQRQGQPGGQPRLRNGYLGMEYRGQQHRGANPGLDHGAFRQLVGQAHECRDCCPALHPQ